MTDRFATWDTFYRHFTLTQDPRKALRWTRYDLWTEKRRRPFLELEAEEELAKSLANINGKA